MRFKWTVALMMFLLALVSCRNGERATVTGGYGAAVVTGEVVMVSAGSPQGVEVTVRGTGQTMTLGADGRFVFSGVPSDVDLQFRRASDGIDASLRLEDVAGHIVIELAKTEARPSSSKRRGIRGGGQTIVQIEGLIRTATDAQIVVYSSHKEEVTIALTADTVIRKGGTVLTPADLLPDTRVHIKAQRTDTGLAAVQVVVQNRGEDDDDGEDNGAAVREYEGLVVSAAIDRLVIFDSHQTEVAFVLNVDTVIRKGNRPVLATDIQPGWRVHVKAATGTDGNRTATRVTIQNANGGGDDGGAGETVKLSGRVTAVGPTELTVQADGGAAITVRTDAATRIEKKKAPITLAQVVAGDKVKVAGTPVSETVILAREIEVR